MAGQGRTVLWSTVITVVLLAGCTQQRAMRRIERHIALHQHRPYIEVALQRRHATPGMTLDDVRVALGPPLPVRRMGSRYGLPLAEAYRVRRFGRTDTVWVFFDRDSTVVLVER